MHPIRTPGSVDPSPSDIDAEFLLADTRLGMR
jgi:hypothetical protein